MVEKSDDGAMEGDKTGEEKEACVVGKCEPVFGAEMSCAKVTDEGDSTFVMKCMATTNCETTVVIDEKNFKVECMATKVIASAVSLLAIATMAL